MSFRSSGGRNLFRAGCLCPHAHSTGHGLTGDFPRADDRDAFAARVSAP